MNTQKGFAVLESLLILVIIAIIGGTGYYVWHAKKYAYNTYDTTTSSAINAPDTSQGAPSGWKEYTNTEAGLRFNYPADWSSQVDDIIRGDDGTFGGVSGDLTAPSGKKLNWTYYYVGGKGGGCEPAKADKPFAVGNTCSTKQILSVEKIKSVQPPKAFKDRSLFEDSLYITHTKYQAVDSTTPKYYICLDAYYSSYAQPEVGTEMGLLFQCDHWTSGFNAEFEVSSEADFNSKDAITAEKIMKSFDSIH